MVLSRPPLFKYNSIQKKYIYTQKHACCSAHKWNIITMIKFYSFIYIFDCIHTEIRTSIKPGYISMCFFSFSERHKELLSPLSGLRRLRSFPTQNRCICEHRVVTRYFMHIGIYVTRIFTREKGGGRGIRPTTCATVMIRFLWDRVT